MAKPICWGCNLGSWGRYAIQVPTPTFRELRSRRRYRSFLNHALLIKVAAVQLSFIMCSVVVSWIYAFYVAFRVRNGVVMSLTNGFRCMLYSLSNLGMSSVIRRWMFPRGDDVIPREIFRWNFVRKRVGFYLLEWIINFPWGMSYIMTQHYIEYLISFPTIYGSCKTDTRAISYEHSDRTVNSSEQ